MVFFSCHPTIGREASTIITSDGILNFFRILSPKTPFRSLNITTAGSFSPAAVEARATYSKASLLSLCRLYELSCCLSNHWSGFLACQIGTLFGPYLLFGMVGCPWLFLTLPESCSAKSAGTFWELLVPHLIPTKCRRFQLSSQPGLALKFWRASRSAILMAFLDKSRFVTTLPCALSSSKYWNRFSSKSVESGLLPPPILRRFTLEPTQLDFEVFVHLVPFPNTFSINFKFLAVLDKLWSFFRSQSTTITLNSTVYEHLRPYGILKKEFVEWYKASSKKITFLNTKRLIRKYWGSNCN